MQCKEESKSEHQRRILVCARQRRDGENVEYAVEKEWPWKRKQRWL